MRTKQIPQAMLQAIFDMNGLDAFDCNSKQLTVKKGEVTVDAKLYEYCRPFSEVVIRAIQDSEDLIT